MAEKVTLISDIPVTNDIQDGSKFLLDNSTDGSASVTTMLALKNYILEQLGSSDSIELKDSKFETKLSEALDNLLEVTADVMSEDGSTVVTKGGLYVGKTVVYITEADYNTLVTDSKVDANKLYVILLTKAQETDPDKFKMVLNGKEIAIGSELTGSDSVEIQNDVITARLSEATDNLLKVSADVMDETGDAVVTKGGLYVGNNLVYITEDDYNSLVTDSKVDTEKLYVVILNKTAESDPDKFKLVFNGKEIKIADETSNTIEDLTEAEIIELVDAMDGEYTPQSSILVLNMTSNTTPAPYSASASSIYGGDNNAYYAFNAGTNVPWQTANNTPSAWIQLDMGSRTKITSFSITTRTTIPTSAPKDFILYGSDDGTSYTEIKAFSNQIGWSVGETRNFDLGGVYNYQIYKLDIITNNGYSFTSVQHIKFYKYTENDSDKNGINKYSLREILADSGIGKKANHANREVLDKFSEDTEGNPLYNGNPISGGGISDVSNEPNNAITVKDDGIWSKNYDADIASLRVRTKAGEKLLYCQIGLSAIQTSIVDGTIVKFDTILDSNGIQINSTNYSVKLLAGRTYRLTPVVGISNPSGNIKYSIYNLTKSINISKKDYWSISTNQPDTWTTNSCMPTIYECTEDCEVVIKIISTVSSPQIQNTQSMFIVEEIARQYYEDQAERMNDNLGIEDAPVGHVISYMGTIAPKHYLICDGSVYNIVDYPKLAEHIFKQFGSYNYWGGDGINTFAVPDMRGEFVRGVDTTALSDPQGATRGVGKHQEATTVQNFFSNGADLLTLYDNIMHYTGINADKTYSKAKGAKPISLSSANTSFNNAISLYTTRPTNVNTLFCIKAEPTYYMHADKLVYGGFKKETIWEGYLSGATDSATLSNPITDYSLLIVEWNQFTQETPILETLTIEINDNIDYAKQYISMGNVNRYVNFKFSDSTTLTNVGVNNFGGSTVGITRVIGIKTSDTSTDVVYATEEEVTTAINDILNDATT